MEKKTEKEEKYMKELQDRYIRFDWAIKRLLRQKANFGVLEGFLTVFLGDVSMLEKTNFLQKHPTVKSRPERKCPLRSPEMMCTFSTKKQKKLL